MLSTKFVGILGGTVQLGLINGVILYWVVQKFRLQLHDKEHLIEIQNVVYAARGTSPSCLRQRNGALGENL